MQNINSKSILVIMPYFFKYEEEIVRGLKDEYDYVYLKSEIPIRFFYYALLFFSRRVVSILNETYSKRLARFVIKNNIDNVFIIRGGGLTSVFFKSISLNQNIKIFHYQWDSIKNNANSLLISKFTSLNFTFDKLDSLKYDFKYVPLFYSSDCLKCESICSVENSNEVLFVGSYQYERYLRLKQFSSEFQRFGLTLKTYLYISFFVFLKEFFLKNHRIKLSDVKFKKMSRLDVYKMTKKSSFILDIANNKQSGITMRTFETLMLQRKIITTNKNLVNEKCYTPNNIYVCDDTNFCRFESFELFVNKKFDVTYNDSILSVRDWLLSIGLINR